MNYGTYTEYNTFLKMLNVFVLFPSILEQIDLFEYVFGMCDVFCTINCYFGFRIWILCIFLYIGTYFEDCFRHFRQKSNIFPEV